MLLAGSAASGALGSTVPHVKLPTTIITSPPAVPAPPPGSQSVDYGYDAAHDFAASDPAITLPLGARWSVKVAGDPAALLAADNLDFVVVDEPSGVAPTGAVVEALDPDTGAAKWSRTVPLGAAIAYESGVLAVGGGNAVQALASATGAPMWSLPLQGVTAITPSGGELYADAAGGPGTADTIDAINLTTGKPLWSVKPPTAGGAGPLGIAGERVYRAETTQWQAFDRATGRLIWHQSSSVSPGSADTATLWQTQLFRVGFTAGFSLPGTTLDGTAISAATGQPTSGSPAEIVSGEVGLVTRGTGVAALNLTTGGVLWSSLAQPLAILNGDALTYRASGLQLRDLNTGQTAWSATLTPSPTTTPVTAVGNQELLVGAGGHVTALVPAALASHSVKFSIPTQYSVYGGAPAVGRAKVTEPGVRLAQQLTIAGEPWPFKHYGPGRPVSTSATGVLKFTERPPLNTIYRITVPGSTRPIGLFEIVALPRVAYRFLTPSLTHAKLHGNVLVTVAVPRSVHLARHRVTLYLGIPKGHRYLRLGAGLLTGGNGHFAARLAFKLEQHVAASDFVTACFAGIHKQGMSFGDALDKRCGAEQIRF
jgi:outer membrane protein assembly factor BamB